MDIERTKPVAMAEDERSEDEQSPVLFSLLLAILITALLTGPAVFVRLLNPSPAWELLLPVVFFVALEAIVTTRWLAHPERRSFNRLSYRAAEVVVLAFLVRLLTWLVTGGFPGWATWYEYLISPLTFLDGVFVVYLVLAGVAWERGSFLTNLYGRLTLSPGERAYYSLGEEEQRRRIDRPVDFSRPEVFESFVRSWLNGGLVMALFAALTSVDFTRAADEGIRSLTRLGMEPQMLLALILYFILGLWLVSRARLTMMQARWTADGVKTLPDMSRRWRRGSIVLLLLIALVAAFLPIGSTLGIATLLALFFRVILAVAQFIFLLLTLLGVLFLSLFSLPSGGEEPVEQAPIEPPLELPPITPAPLGETATLFAGATFWALAALIAAAAFLFFVRERGIRLNLDLLAHWWERIDRWLQRLWHSASERAVTLQDAVRVRLQREAGTAAGSATPWRFLRVGALPPREQVRYFSLSTVRRASEAGVERQESETPSEYARDLQAEWPEAEAEISALTDAFLEARYSARAIDSDDASAVKKVWKAVRASVRRRRQKDSA
ncbi:MAG: DUF4129 domain-containing protein [Candidatus Promineifilaceae bacterium]|nr:DUF4129 domain-containing protein [Candidatus Promineifilaceae bacterium]